MQKIVIFVREEVDKALLYFKINAACAKFNVNVSEFQHFLARFDGDVNKIHAEDRQTPLTKAINENRPDFIKVLIAVGADINAIDNFGFTPLTFAVTENKPEIVKLLYELGACLTTPDGANRNPLEYAILQNNIAIVKLLCIDLKADINYNGRDYEGFTPLTFALMNDRLEMFKLLIELGAKIDNYNAKGHSALYYAIKENKSNYIRLLAELGANLSEGPKYAIDENNFEALTLFKELGIDLNSTNLFYNLSSLFYAVLRNKTRMIEHLVKLGCNLFQVNDDGMDLIMHARLQECSEEVIVTLTKLGLSETACKRVHEEILLANIWGLKGKTEWKDIFGKTHSVGLEGMSGPGILKQLDKYVDAFFSLSEDDGLSPKDKTTIQQAIAKTYPLVKEPTSEVLARIKDKENPQPYVILGGKVNHAITMVINGGQLVICNRGSGRQSNACEIYSLPVNIITTKCWTI